ncbi:MAG TPA: glycosyltransferase family 2 protein [Polyangia bacterium]|jgi:glycosyltransferase involved in cell wall biosynthesis|nr:glycosyltransferase family 2 protein [Polyangia bacterium]
MPSLHIVIPAFNEGRVIGTTLANLPRTFAGVDETVIVVVDDGSTDDTTDVITACGDARVVLLRHAINRGLGGALGTGLEYARLRGADYVVTYDADGQHAPDDIAAILAPLVDGKADAVIGSRLINPAGMPWHRVVGNWGLNLFTYFVFGMWTTDSQSGMRGFSKAALAQIQVRMDRMEVSSEFIKEIRRCRLRYTEVPIRAIYSDYSLAKGQSNWNAFNILIRLVLHRLMED